MENNSFNRNSSETPAEAPEKPEKSEKSKRRRSFRAPLPGSQPMGERAAEKPNTTLNAEAPKPEASVEKPVAAKNEQAKETPANPETLSESEARHITQEIARERLQAIEQAEPEAAESLQPASEFLEKVSQGVEVDEAFSEVASELGLTEEELTATLETAPEAEAGSDEAVDGPNEDQVPESKPAEGFIDTSANEAEGEVDLSAASLGQPAASGGQGGGGSIGTSGSNAPAGGADDGAPRNSSGPAPASPRRFRGLSPVAPRTAEVAAAVGSLPEAVSSYYQRRSNAGELLVIGLVGYLIGRRRGRIKTEKRLLPTQKKLEKQVRSLQETIVVKEQQLVAAKAARQAIEQPASVRTEIQQPVERPLVRMQPGRQETRLGLEKPARAEQLGQVVMAAAEAPKVAERLRMEQPSNIRQAFRAEEVPAMKHHQLLELSEKIVVEGASLRSVYDAHLVGERQLRHLVSEYLQGKDIRQSLRREMVEHEIDFERDPQMRDRAHSQADNSGSDSGGKLLTRMLADDKEIDPALKHRIERDAALEEQQQKKARRQSQAVDAALITAIVVLAIVVVVLVFNR